MDSAGVKTWRDRLQNPYATAWLEVQEDLGLAPRTLDAYARGVADFLALCARDDIDPLTANRFDVARYVRDLTQRHHRSGDNVISIDSGAGLANATIQQRLVAVRLFYDHLMEEGMRYVNPVGRGRYTPGKSYGGQQDKGLLLRFHRLPWIPTDEQWLGLLNVARDESIRNRFMLGLAYDAGLRREELCLLQTDDIDPAHRTIRVRVETTKNRLARVVPYSAVSGALYVAYTAHRRELSRARGPLFLSDSRRNLGESITPWTWSKFVRRLALRAGLPQFSTHTLRHLCLTDLARAGWEIHAIAQFAGHRNTVTTQQYIHLSGRELALKLDRAMAGIHGRRLRDLADTLT